MTRSNSSYEIRQKLMIGHEVEDVKNSIPIHRYFDKAKQLYKRATESMKENYTSRSYIYWKQFIIFVVDKLPNHKSYRSSDYEIRSSIQQLKRATDCAFEILESLVEKLDHEEDLVRSAAEIDLIDEFDCCNKLPTDIALEHESNDNNGRMSRSLEEALKIIGQEDESQSFSTGDSYPVTYTESEIAAPSKDDSYSSVSVYEIEILYTLHDIRRFDIPQPHRTLLSFSLFCNGAPHQMSFYRHDFHVSFSSFLPNLPSTLKECKYAVETNRCFFIHLGVALNIHPFALQVYFRRFSADRVAQTSDDLEKEILNSCLQYAGFVDANCLLYIWPEEFHDARVCIISGTTKPMFTTFYSGEDCDRLRDIVVHSDGAHFTLLKPVSAERSSHFSVLPYLLSTARSAGCVVQEIRVDLSSAVTVPVEEVVHSL
eukprot:CAMPEP_0185041780 /NCGR_PEP_ID=MMETSP1103-20130426/41527_1 /TAXON_ID=36769 /ORGANISM="Paraphysomonas bandaiensis, Strain Caron Lab Isolate" /LENGTH=427 /DNA_ID=CAMNT_0027581673 /DNA_START=49 /DNA_END=1329 /DNA_ORIENTATION=+